jgi:hypothetical protein
MVFSLDSLTACFESAALPFKIQPFFTYILLAMFLSHLIETEEFSDLSIADFMVKSTTAFEKLFEDQSQMNVSVVLFSKYAIVISTKTSYVSVSFIIKYYKIKAFTIPCNAAKHTKFSPREPTDQTFSCHILQFRFGAHL